jgi:transposase
VRDDRPFAGPAPPAAVFFYSPDRRGEHPEHHLRSFAGILQADAYAGFNKLYDGARRPGSVTEAACWAHGRRKFFELAAARTLRGIALGRKWRKPATDHSVAAA